MIPSRTFYLLMQVESYSPFIVEGMVELNQFVVDDQVIKKSKSKGIM